MTGLSGEDLDLRQQAFVRRFDLEHTFRTIKQTLVWTRLKLRTPAAADRWTPLIIAGHTQLRLVRPLIADLRRPWEKPVEPGRLTPGRQAARLEEPACRHPLRRRQNHQTPRKHHRTRPVQTAEHGLRRERPARLLAIQPTPCPCTRRPRPHRPSSHHPAAHQRLQMSTPADRHACAPRRAGSWHLHPARRAIHTPTQLSRSTLSRHPLP